MGHYPMPYPCADIAFAPLSLVKYVKAETERRFIDNFPCPTPLPLVFAAINLQNGDGSDDIERNKNRAVVVVVGARVLKIADRSLRSPWDLSRQLQIVDGRPENARFYEHICRFGGRVDNVERVELRETLGAYRYSILQY